METMLYLGLLLALGQAVSGQNLTYSGNCTHSINGTSKYTDNIYFNATATINFTLPQLTGNDDPWYYHLILSAPANDNPQGKFIHRWLSVPESFLGSDVANRTLLCAYTIGGQDASLKNEQGNDTCAGVISDKCQKSFDARASDVESSGCPSVTSGQDCDSVGTYSAGPKHFPKNLCRVMNAPGIDVPKGYATVMTLSVSYGSAYDESEPFKDYDVAVKQAVPEFLQFFTSDGDDQQSSAVLQPVCAVPNNVQEGSRPLDSRGRKLEMASSAALVMAMSLLYNIIM